jgi:hypothetical protein
VGGIWNKFVQRIKMSSSVFMYMSIQFNNSIFCSVNLVFGFAI